MKNHKKDEVSDSSDNPDLDGNGSPFHKSEDLDSSRDNDSDSGNIRGVNENSKNELTSDELPRTISAETVERGKSASVKSIFNFEDLSSEDEIYTLQCPSVYEKQSLLDKSIDLTKPGQTVTSGTEEFQLELLNSEKKSITLAVPKALGGGTLIKLPLKGHIIIQKIVNAATDDVMTNDVHNDSKVVFPQDIKIRHPLLGVNWQDHIKMANKAIKKSNKNNESFIKEKSLKKEEKEKKLKRKSNDESPIHKKKKKLIL